MACQQEPGYNSFSCPAAVAKVGACSGSCWWSPTRTRYIFVLLPSRGSVWWVLVRVLVHICGTFDTFCIIHAHSQPGQHLLTIPTPTMTPTISVICCHGWAGVRISQTCIMCHEYEQLPQQLPSFAATAGQERDKFAGSCWEVPTTTPTLTVICCHGWAGA